nr:MAG TPA: hypothetical protein [Caudoviricetes sp.]
MFKSFSQKSGSDRSYFYSYFSHIKHKNIYSIFYCNFDIFLIYDFSFFFVYFHFYVNHFLFL